MTLPHSSLQLLLQQIEAGDAAAAQQLWDQFFDRMLRFIETKIRNRKVPAGLVDEEAVAASVFESVFKCAKAGRFHNISTWGELSQLLYAMTNRKFVDHWRRATSRRAYPGRPPKPLSRNMLPQTNPQLEGCKVAFEDQLARLMEILPDETHRRIAILKLAEYSLEEISQEMNCAVPTVNRKWRNVRMIWGAELKQ
jgi:DNA-directed RNA polymerase specialized sigma24 family protein